MHTKHTGVAFIALCAMVVCSLPVYAASMTSLNMAIEYEHRKVGSSENNALSLGVHYWF